MICRELMVGGARTFGMETARAFGSAYWFGPQSQREGPWVAPLFTAGNLFYLAILTYMAGKKGLGKPSLLRHLITAYMVITGIVEITRFVWDVSRFALVWAALHNLAEWGIIGFTVFQAKEADAHWWRSQVWILAVSQVILFAPTLSEGGLYEQIAGLTCDWLLLGVWSYLFHRADQHKRKYVIWGLLGAVGHMLEILPLVSLLIGVVSVPSTFGSVLISFTTPITFYCYMRMVQGFDDSGDDDLVTSPAHDDCEPGQDLSVPMPIFSAMVVAALLCSAATILGPVLIIPTCPAAGMVVPPGMVLPSERAAIGAATDLSGTKSGNPIDGKVPAAPGTSGGSGGGGRAIGSNETLCPSQSKLTGTTTIVAKPGMGDKLMEMVATMPGPIRQEDGARYYEEAWGGDNSATVKFFESWSSIRSLYKHIYTSPAVARVFRSAAFSPMLADKPKLEGPFKAMIPCSEAEKEAGTVHIPMSTVIDAPVDCLWDRIDAWSTDCSWVQHSQYITMPNENMPFLRELHFPSTTVPVIRQVAPLPEPEQPNGGHRLIYYMLGGGFMDTMAEMYRGDLTIVPQSSTKTLFTYTATIVAKDPSLTNQLFDSINNDFNSKTGRIQFLQQWGREVANSARCKAAHPPVPPAPAPAPSKSSADYFYVFKLPQDAPAMPDTISMLKFLLSKQPTYLGPEPEVLYAANVGRRNFPATKVPGPDLKKSWSVTLVVRFPTGCTVRPAAVGDGVALDTYRVAVREKKLPSAAAAAKCPDSHTLDKAIKAVQPEVDAMFGNFKKWYKAMQANATDPALPVKPDTPMSGINLLQYKSGRGVIGQTCYGRYLREAYKLISKYGGGLYYFGEVVDEGSESWDEIVIPLYNDGKAFFKVVFDKKYYGLLGLRDATLSDQANIDVAAITGSVMLIP